MVKEIKIRDIKIGARNPFVLIAGPCVIESEESSLYHARKIKQICDSMGIKFIFKSSYDKANRTSLDSYRGPGLKNGLKILAKVKKDLKLPVLSDVHCRSEVKEAAKVLDVIQVPAFLSRQTDLIVEVAKTKKVINLKKGQFLAPWDMGPIVKKIESAGNKNILITERGVSFGYNNLVSDFRALSLMRQFGYPVIFDATHSVQLPGGRGDCSGGQREFVASLARAAIAFGCDGLFLEAHRAPDEALCDGPNSISLKELENILKITQEIDGIVLKNRLR
ncbi:MAG: 3-deoxy-8-phosphooctulonate synthase [Candidatus Omnitrophica bacterium]|nr:3-deoxy-8-phosphooctulonate synthase [Candidatus Omnitrophota bacterium]MDD5351845.1 3-deoxy-8-phosphooctulonate synthase [Candidatus Omnitrophota bacterium]MDD5550671.1 3-deoxy-8-phosphooctulonate synthase [Candidatus Omnitrophota bacterium]